MNIQIQKQKIKTSRSLCRRRSLLKTKRQQNQCNTQASQIKIKEKLQSNQVIFTEFQKPLRYNDLLKTSRPQQSNLIKNSIYYGDCQSNIESLDYSNYKRKSQSRVLSTEPIEFKDQVKFLRISKKLRKRSQKVTNETQQLIFDNTEQGDKEKPTTENSNKQLFEEENKIKCIQNTINNKQQEFKNQNNIFKLSFDDQTKQKIENIQIKAFVEVSCITQFSNMFGDEIISAKNAVYSTIPKGKIVKCLIKRIKTFNTCLQMYLEDTHFLMKSELQRGSIGSNHYISISKEVNKKSRCYLGKLRSDFMNSSYSLYDNGISEKQNKQIQLQRRMCLANVEYQNNVLSPRRIKVVIPNPRIHNRQIFKLGDKQSLSQINTLHPYSLITLNNKKSKWDQKNKRYFLDFKNNKTFQYSSKNFIIENDEGQQILLFGKINKDTFSLVFRYPFNTYQAFGIALSSLQAAVGS